MGERPVALVTGSGRGIGRACAEALAARGFDIVVHERSPLEDTEATLDAVRALGGNAGAVHGDIADLAVHAELLDEGWKIWGHIDCLVNNAGVSVLSRGDLLDVGTESWDRCFDVNTRGTFFLSQAFAKQLLTHPDRATHRSIVFVTSCNAEAVSINRGEYCASKAAAGMLAKLFAVRLAPHGIGVYEIRPGIIETEMTRPSKERYDRFFAGGHVPVPRWGQPAEVGRCVAAAAVGDLPYTVGQPIAVDGGLVIPRL
jgi:3-oxoacyl-[acyl-carrier protein] reductase